MDQDKVYYPEIIETYALPETVVEEETSSTNYVGKTNLVPTTQVDKKFPPRNFARETISETLNTRTKKILGEFTFGQVGAIAIGVYENGVSGDIRITPNGITARDINGNATFSIDGNTGDAVFKGTVTAGSVISGSIISGSVISGEIYLGGANNGDGLLVVRDALDNDIVILDKDGITINNGKIELNTSGSTTIIDSLGLISGSNFPFAQITSSDTGDNNDTTNYADVTDMTVDVTVARTQQILVMARFAGGEIEGTLTTVPYAQAVFRLVAGSTQLGNTVSISSIIHDSGTSVSYALGEASINQIVTLPAGTTTIKLQFKSSISGQTVRVVPSRCELIYFKMGS